MAREVILDAPSPSVPDMRYPDRFDVVVIGGGHAGTEAALASARLGAKTLLLTQSIETLGQMSCNPAIGGIGKSHLVKEVDALGGVMAEAADQAGIHFRTLNSRKGPAVRATRAQTDRQLYKAAVRQRLENCQNLTLFQQSATDLILEQGRVAGVRTGSDIDFPAHRVVLTAGTFLGGVIHVGTSSEKGGRAGDAPSNALAARLRELPFRVARLKTGTPPRIDRRTVDFSCMEEQPGENPRPVMSFLGHPGQHPEQRSCYITETNERTHDIIRGALSRSPIFSGAIQGQGPRYCPSIEDKVVRFADKSRHQVFVEPEGLHAQELYPNGISTSLPFDTQLQLVRSMRGFEEAVITRPGYAIEYDFFDPRDLRHTLETRHLPGLYFAGQINGTTGYEEAAAQGLIAGSNAALAARGLDAFTLGRDQAYIGVLIDDLVTLGTDEPYRMFTSRAEYRLLLRQDNADRRLTEKGRRLGLVDDLRWQQYADKLENITRGADQLRQTRVRRDSPQAEKLNQLLGQPLTRDATLAELLKRPELTLALLLDSFGLSDSCWAGAEVREQVEIDTKYAGYLARQQAEIDRLKASEALRLPKSLDYSAVPGLSSEVRQKLQRVQPETLAQAGRISGVTPAALSLLLIHLRAQRDRAA